MAWNTPTTRAAGYTVPVSVWNSDVVDNPIALRAGALAIALQAQGDVIVASSSTQLDRVAPGASGTVLMSNGVGVAPSFQSLTTGISVQDRDVTTATVGPSDNTEQTVYSYTVPGGTLGSTKALRISALGDFLNTTGGAAGYTIRVKYGASTILTDVYTCGSSANRGSIGFTVILAANNGTSTQKARGEFFDGTGTANNATGTASATISVNTAVNNSISVDSTSNQTLAITLQLSASHASLEARIWCVFVELL